MVKLPRSKVIFKDDTIVELCKGKSVLHLGATDAPFHAEREKNKTLLHMKIRAVANSCVGLDYDKAAIAFLRKKGIDDIYFGDLVAGNYSHEIRGTFDVIVFGDVIEHLDNPGIALRNISRFMSKSTRLVMTCPNVHCLHTYRTFCSGNEDVHPDHMFWPSYNTMKVLVERNGYSIKKFAYCMWGSESEIGGIRWQIYRVLLRLKPYLAPAMVFELGLRK